MGEMRKVLESYELEKVSDIQNIAYILCIAFSKTSQRT